MTTNQIKTVGRCAFTFSLEETCGTGAHMNTSLSILHSDSTSDCMINSCACRELGDKYAALRNTFCWLWRAPAKKKEEKNRLMDRWKNTGLQMAYFIKDMAKCLSNPITPAARSHTGLFRLVTDAITIHTCSSHLRLHLTGETPALFPSFSAGHARTKQDVWLWNSWRPPSKTKIKEQNLTEIKCHDLLRSYIYKHSRQLTCSVWTEMFGFSFSSHIKEAQAELRIFFLSQSFPWCHFFRKKKKEWSFNGASVDQY